jgi:hypothetical protein
MVSSQRISGRHISGPGIPVTIESKEQQVHYKEHKTMHKQESSNMRRTKMLILCAIAAMALSAVVSASASATKNPKWALCETRGPNNGQWSNGTCTTLGGEKTHETRLLLTENETREITAEANGNQRLASPGAPTVICKKLKLRTGAILLGGEPGKGAGSAIFEECEVEGKPNCKIKNVGGVNGTIETHPVTATLVYSSKAAEEKENQAATLTLFKPTTGEIFVELEIEGTECPEALRGKAFPVKGEVLGENTGGNEHLVTHELNFPTTAFKTYWLQVGGVATEKEIKKLMLATLAASYSGKTKASLAGSQTDQDWWIV